MIARETTGYTIFNNKSPSLNEAGDVLTLLVFGLYSRRFKHSKNYPASGRYLLQIPIDRSLTGTYIKYGPGIKATTQYRADCCTNVGVAFLSELDRDTAVQNASAWGTFTQLKEPLNSITLIHNVWQ